MRDGCCLSINNAVRVTAGAVSQSVTAHDWKAMDHAVSGAWSYTAAQIARCYHHSPNT